MTRPDRARPGALPWIALALALVALAATALAWSGARRDAAALHAWQATMLRQIARAGGRTPVSLAPADAADALARIVAARDGALAMTAALPVPIAPPPAPAPDTGTEISRLRATRSSGTAAGDARMVDRDSRAAWTGWR